MIKLILHIVLLSYILAKELPNDVKWVTSSNEYRLICKNTFNRAYENFKSIIGTSKKVLNYKTFRSSLKNGNTLSISKIRCSQDRCIGNCQEQKNDFIVNIPSLSNALINQIKKNHIDYKYLKNLDRHISKKK